MNSRAFNSSQFEIFYQPLVNLISGQISGFEALLRWKHPNKGYISPVSFIPVAEDTGLIIPLGNFVLKTAIAQLATWQKTIPSLEQASIAINVSGKQLMRLDLIDRIEHILHETKLNPGHLKIEITESILIENFDLAILNLQQLRQLGIKLSIDDFGTGYSSLGRLQNLPIDIIKIDRCFVIDMEQSKEKLGIVRAIASIAQIMNIEVIVEGIETPNQLTIIRELECDEAQGFYFSRPLNVESIATLLSNPLHWSDHFIDILPSLKARDS